MGPINKSNLACLFYVFQTQNAAGKLCNLQVFMVKARICQCSTKLLFEAPFHTDAPGANPQSNVLDIKSYERVL